MKERYPWRYRCSICQELLDPDEVARHADEEKAKPDWRGVMSLTRVDLDEEGNPIGTD